MNRALPIKKALQVLSLLAVGLAMTSADAIAQRRPLPPDPRNPFQREPTVGELREGRWFVDVRAGIANPVGDWGDAADSGLSMGFVVGQWVGEQYAFRFRTDIDLPSGTMIERGINAGQEGPSWQSWHIDVGMSYDVTQGAGPMMLAVDLGFGGTLIESDEFQGKSVSQWYLSATPGLRMGLALGQTASFIVDGRYRLLFGDKDALASFLPDAASTLSHMQFQAGFQFYVSPSRFGARRRGTPPPPRR